MKSYPYYAIEAVGYGKYQRHIVKKVVSQGLLLLAYEKATYRTLEAAKNAASERGIEIACTGDLYQII